MRAKASPAGQERGCLLSVAGAAGQGRQEAPSLPDGSPAPGSGALPRLHGETPSGGRPSVGLGEPAGFSPPPCRRGNTGHSWRITEGPSRSPVLLS